MPSSLSPLAALVRKDLSVEARDPRGLWVLFSASAVAGVLAASAASASGEPAAALAAAHSVAALLLAVMASYFAFSREAAWGTLDGLRAAPVPGWLHILAKSMVVTLLVAGQLLVLAAVADLLTPGASASWPHLAAWTLLASIALASIASFTTAAMAFGEQAGGAPALALMALAAPYLHAASRSLEAVMAGAAPPPGSLEALAASSMGVAVLLVALGGVVLE